MLKIQRVLNQGFHIGDEIEVILLDYDPELKQVIIGIEAPKKFKILRNELILKDKREASIQEKHYMNNKNYMNNKDYNK